MTTIEDPPAGSVHPAAAALIAARRRGVTVPAAVSAVPVHLLRGSDPVLLDRAVTDLVSQLVGAGDRTLMVDELVAASYDPGGTGEVQVGPLRGGGAPRIDDHHGRAA